MTYTEVVQYSGSSILTDVEVRVFSRAEQKKRGPLRAPFLLRNGLSGSGFALAKPRELRPGLASLVQKSCLGSLCIYGTCERELIPSSEIARVSTGLAG